MQFDLPQIEPLVNLEIIDYIQSREPIKSPAEAAAHIGELALTRPFEQSFAIFLDGDLHPIAVMQCGAGTPNRTPVDVHSIVVSAILLYSRGVILAHTHPAGGSDVGQPSSTDIETTRDLDEKLRWFGIKLVDSFLLEHCADQTDGLSLTSIKNWIKSHEKENSETNKTNETEEQMPEVAMI